MPNSSFPSEKKVSLNSLGSLFNEAWKLYTDRFSTVISIMLPPVLLIGLGETFKAIGFPLSIAGSILLLVGALLSIIALAAVIYSFQHKTGFDGSYTAGVKSFWPLIWVVIIVCFAVFGGFVMLVIPGIWLAIGLAFSNYIVVLEEKRGLNALIASREYVKGYWWATFGRILLLVVTVVVFNLIVSIPFVLIGGAVGRAIASTIILLFIGPFSIAYYYTIYRNFTVLKPHLRESKATDGKTFIVVAQIVAVVIIFLVVIGTIFGVAVGQFSPRMNYQYELPPYVPSRNLQSGGAPSASPTITNIDPTSGPVGAQVTITGTGFGSDNTIFVDGLTVGALEDISSSDGATLTFTMPGALAPYCPTGTPCPQFLRTVTPGVYQISVLEGGVKSNTTPFTITAE